jgi:Ca2+-dependent lipid-binding protein
VLGCDNLHKSDLIGLSDPFCVVYWCGKKLGVTSTRYETLSPRWTAETFAIPAGDSIYHAQNEDEAQDQQALRIEVYDRDMFSKSDFLGQLRIHNTQLCELARTVHGTA